MEEQKNPSKNVERHHKNQKPRHKGYFMEPPTEKQNDISVKEFADKDGSISEKSNYQKEQKKSVSQTTHKNNNHHYHSDKNKHNVQAEMQNEKDNENQSLTPSENTTPQNQGRKNKKSKKRNKKKNRAQSQSADVPHTDVTNTKENTDNTKNQQSKKRFPGDKMKIAADKEVTPLSADDYEEYTLSFEEDSPSDTEDKEVEKTEVVGVRFKITGNIYYFDPCGKQYKKGMKVIVDTARGQEFGEIAMSNSTVRSSDIVSPLRNVIRGATAADVEHHNENRKKEEEAFKVCSERIAAHGLDMKLIEAQYTFDNTKLLFYFISSERVDFRNLVKDLASLFRTRIELRQIGIRDEAKLMGGLGMCGRPLCCTLFLSDFDQVSIKMAKEQNLSLNTAKISGICGRLMCCLRYEHEAYEYEIKRTPPVDSLVRTENGDGIVTEIRPIQGTIKVRLLSSPETPPKVYKRDEVTMLRKKQNNDK